MDRFALDTLVAEDRAFVESMAGINEKLEALKIVFPSGRLVNALTALQQATVSVTAAAIRVKPL